MAQDATGTPTPLGIPKYNPAADAPSGRGFNAAMDAIDALILARSLPTAGAANQVPVWNGSAWVAQAVTAAQIQDGTVGTAELADASVVGRKIQWSEGSAPPGSPSEGDLWIYTGIAGTQWLFRYDPTADGTYPWHFIGGAPWVARQDAEALGAGGGFYVNAFNLQLTAPRTGVYGGRVSTMARIDNAPAIDVYIGIGRTGSSGSDAEATKKSFLTAGHDGSIHMVNEPENFLATGGTAIFFGTNAVGNNWVSWDRSLTLWPVRWQ